MLVIFKAKATKEPAAEPRPGPTGIPVSSASRTKSQTINIYPGNFILLIIFISSSNLSLYF